MLSSPAMENAATCTVFLLREARMNSAPQVFTGGGDGEVVESAPAAEPVPNSRLREGKQGLNNNDMVGTHSRGATDHP